MTPLLTLIIKFGLCDRKKVNEWNEILDVKKVFGKNKS